MGHEIQGCDDTFVASFFAQFACTTLQQNGTVRLGEKQNAWERGPGNNEAQPKGPAPIDRGDEAGHEWRDDRAHGCTLLKLVNVAESKKVGAKHTAMNHAMVLPRWIGSSLMSA
jgi:hypothetical protein